MEHIEKNGHGMCGIELFSDLWLPLCGAQPRLFRLLSKQPDEDRGNPAEKSMPAAASTRLQVVRWNTHAIMAPPASFFLKAGVLIIFFGWRWCVDAAVPRTPPSGRFSFITIILSSCHLLAAAAVRRICASRSRACVCSELRVCFEM